MVASLHGTGHTGSPERPYPVERESRLLEIDGDLLPHLETVEAYAGAYGRTYVGRKASPSACHLEHRLGGDMVYGASPAAVCRAYDFLYGIIQQNRNTVGSPHAYRHSPEVRHQGIHSLKVITAYVRTADNLHPCGMGLMGLQDGIRQSALLPRGEGLHSGAHFIFQDFFLHTVIPYSNVSPCQVFQV